jgi:2-haloacid dehalogenase
MSSERKSDRIVSQGRRALLVSLALAPIAVAAAGVHAMHSQSPQSVELSASPIVVFDVNETLLDFNTLTPVFVRIFNDPRMLREWFNQVILYSEALTLAGEYVDSASVGAAVLKMLATAKGTTVEPSDLAELKQRSAAMPTYAGTSAALAKLREAGFRLVTLSNNPTAGLDIQLRSAGIRDFFDQLHSIDERVRRYKPARESYIDLATELGVAPGDLWLVSCHAFDTLGAASAGYRTALILRPENAPIELGQPPEIIESDLHVVVERIVDLHMIR